MWYHVAAVFDSTDPCEPQKLYIDGDLVASGGTALLNPDNDDDPVTIGCRINPLRVHFEKTRRKFDGLIDELRVSNLALLPNQFLMRGDPALAWMSKPKDGEQEVKYDVIFKWRPGDYADSHDVYFGTDYDDVTDAITLTAVIYKGTIGPNEYDPGQLNLETTYYWRIDEVKDSNGHRWKGITWSFTVANYIVIDDFESYDPIFDVIYNYWDNPLYTGAYFELGSKPWDQVNNGVRSLEYEYENTNQYYTGYYSEIVFTSDSPQDWESTGVKMLSLYFYGDPDNDAGDSEQMYVGLADSDSETFIDYNGDMNDIKVSDWQEWNVPLSGFTNVSMSGVEKVYIGFGDRADVPPGGGEGVVYFDNLRIYPPKCVPENGPAYDLSGNCIVNLVDVKIMGSEWLKSDKALAVSAPPTGPVGHWEFEGNADDSSGNNYNGTAEGSYSWVSGKIGSSAIEFTGGKVLVPDDGKTPLLNPATEVSVTAWVKYSEAPEEYTARVVVKGNDENDSENYGLHVNDRDEASFFIRDSNHINYDHSSDEILPHDEWVHIAGVFDGNDVKVYINGDMDSSEDASESTGMLLQDPNGLAIGDAVDVDREFPGAVDDARVYNYALTDAEVAYIGTEGTGIVPLTSIANIYDAEPVGQKAVNFRDYAHLLNSWLEEILWP